jgi:23S rRNA pseudouridine2605 synthase
VPAPPRKPRESSRSGPRRERERPRGGPAAAAPRAAQAVRTAHAIVEPQRIAKLLARAGIASRREIERMITDGRIAIDGVTVETPATILTSLRGVTVDGEEVQETAPARLFRYHKPAGLLTTERDPKGRPTIYDRLPPGLPRLMPVGRLDMNTEGLLLLTTDGELKRQLELPATGVERAYRARVFGPVTQAQLEDLIHGIEIEGVRYGPINANMERRTGRNGWVEMRLREGKNREVRRVLEHLGLQVSRLIRTDYGPFPLADLAPGAVEEIRQHELVAFRKMLSSLKSVPMHDAPPNNPTLPRSDGEPDGRPDRRPPPPPRPAREPQRSLRARPDGKPGPARPGRKPSPTKPERKPDPTRPARPPRPPRGR